MPVATPTAFDGWSESTLSAKAKRKRPDQDSLHITTSLTCPTLIGTSPIMQKLFTVIERVSPNDSSVLLVGATGTGKELVARAIHDKSPRRNGPFVDINCSAIPEGLIEAELFGHQRGTFTGAHESRCGLFEKASGGTLFLDEVDALNLSAQAKLLRVLQEKTVRRIGARANVAVDVRIISATNCDLAQAVAEGRFRPDLYYRLRVLPLQLPELCSRVGDVELLLDHFLKLKADRLGSEAPQFTAEAMRVLKDYPWPGNVRELENAIERAVVLGTTELIQPEDLPEVLLEKQAVPGVQVTEYHQAVKETKRQLVLKAFQEAGGNYAQAARLLGMHPNNLHRLIRNLELELNSGTVA